MKILYDAQAKTFENIDNIDTSTHLFWIFSLQQGEFVQVFKWNREA